MEYNTNTCGTCMAFDSNIVKEGFFSDSYWCKRFQCWRKRDQKACDAYVGGKYNCFLTSACVDQRGLPDNCDELTTLRAFRDSYLKSTSEGNALIEEYYRIAPTLVNQINQRSDKATIYDEIYRDILTCVSLIKDCKYEETVSVYTAMVRRVQKTVNSNLV